MSYVETDLLPKPDTDMRTVYYKVEPEELDALIKRREGPWAYTIYGWVRVPKRHQHDYHFPPITPRLALPV
jgi:hypothetical protein